MSGLKQALIGSGAECETRVDQNGKVGKIGWEPSYRELPEPHSPEDKMMRPLRLKKKIYEFFTAPITKFWADSVSSITYFKFDCTNFQYRFVNWVIDSTNLALI